MKKLFLIVLIILSLLLKFSSYAKDKRSLLLYAPISLKNALDEATKKYEIQDDYYNVKTVFMGTAQLAQQIINGARPDIFISANQGWMDYLEKKNLILKDTKKNYLYNSLVLVTNKKNNSIKKVKFFLLICLSRYKKVNKAKPIKKYPITNSPFINPVNLPGI